jgi:hypothetical protein
MTLQGSGSFGEAGKANCPERAISAACVELRSRDLSSLHEIVKNAGGLFSACAQVGSELDDDAPPRPDVVEGASRNVDAPHFFERHRLGAELNTIGLERTAAATLRLDREEARLTLIGLDLDAIGLAYESELAAPEPDAPLHLYVLTPSTARNVCRRMPQPPIDSQVILSEHAFDVDQGTLPATKDDMLDAGERQEVVLGLRDTPIRVVDHTAGLTSIVTPLGSRAASGSRTS